MSPTFSCSLFRGASLWSMMMRLFPVLAASACGGFNTPPQQVSAGLALSSSALPPRAERDGHVLVVQRLDATVAASAEQAGAGVPFEPERALRLDFDGRWFELARGELPRGDYEKLRLSVTALAVSGTYDGVAFRVTAPEGRTFELSCDRWRVELGKSSSISLVTDPAAWMAERDGDGLKPLAPSHEKASSELMNRFMASLAAVRDDDHDGVEDPGHD